MFAVDHHQEALTSSNLERIAENYDYGSYGDDSYDDDDDDSSVDDEIPSYLRQRKISKGMAAGMDQPSFPTRKPTIHEGLSPRYNRPAGHNSMVDPAASLAPPDRSHLARRSFPVNHDNVISNNRYTEDRGERNRQPVDTDLESVELESSLSPASMEEMQHRVVYEGYVWRKHSDEKRWNRRMKNLTLKSKPFSSTRIFQQHDSKSDPNRKYVVLLYNGTLLFFRSEQDRRQHVNLEKVRHIKAIVATSNLGKGEHVLTFVQTKGRGRDYTVTSEREIMQWVKSGESILSHQ